MKKENKYDLNMNNLIIILSIDSVTLLGIELNFEKSMFQLLFHFMYFHKGNIVYCKCIL